MNVELQLIENPIAIKRALSIDNLYENIILEDFRDWEPNLELADYYFIYVDCLPFGMFVVNRFCSNSLMFHGGVFKNDRNKYTPEVLNKCVNIIKGLYGNVVMMTTISIDNIAAIKMVKKAGFKEKCIIENASKIGDVMILSE